jgi:hypothetical protein
MEMGFEDVALLTAGNLTHMEREKRGDTSGRSRKKKSYHEASRFFHYARHEFKLANGEGKGIQKSAIGRSTSMGVSWFCMSPGKLRTPWPVLNTSTT